MIFISFTKFQYIDDIQDSVYKTETVYLEMEDNLILDDYHWPSFEYIEEDRENIQIDIIHTDFVEVFLENQNSHVSISTILYEKNFFDTLRQQVNDLNHFRIVDYEEIRVKVYLSPENYERIQKNRIIYEEEKKKQEEVCISRSNWKYEQQIQNLKEELSNLKIENKHLEKLLQENSNIEK